MSRIIDATEFSVLYNTFLEKYANSKSHSIGSSFVYETIKSNYVWLISLLVGIAGYSIKFEEETSTILSEELLTSSGVEDPVHKYNSSIKPWVGKTSSGKNPYDPVSNRSLGIGIAHFQAGALSSFYSGEKLSCSVPIFDEDGKPIPSSKNPNKISTEPANLVINGNSISGWGVGYDNHVLDYHKMFSDSSKLTIKKSDNKSIISGNMKNAGIKWVGYDKNKLDKPWMDRQWQEQNIVPWCKCHLFNKDDSLYPPLKWFCSYWVPCIILSLESGHDDITHTIILTGIANSGGIGTAEKYSVYDTETIIAKYVPSLGTKDKLSHDERRIVNMMRVVELVKYLKQVKFNGI